MPKNITSVAWEATPPDGLSFDSATGTFSGTASVSAGEYEIPVKVTTNYGSDEKDVKVVIIKAYPVYALGSNAKTWSADAEADENGVRALPMPKAHTLHHNGEQIGFSAISSNGVYVCGTFNKYNTKDANNKATTPSKIDDGHSTRVTVTLNDSYTVGNTTNEYEQMVTLYRSVSDDVIRAALQKYYCKQSYSTGGSWNNGGTYPFDPVKEVRVNEFESPLEICSDGYFMLDVDTGKIIGNATESNSNSERSLFVNYNYSYASGIKQYRRLSSSNYNANYLILDGSGILHSRTEDFEIADEKIKKFWTNKSGGIVFALTESKKLYVKGSSTNGVLGLGSDITTTNNEFVLVGNIDVNKIEIPSSYAMLLTNDGKLYHTGQAISSMNIEQHYEFEEILKDYKVEEFTIVGTTTLVFTGENKS